jgi:hypothetical protein
MRQQPGPRRRQGSHLRATSPDARRAILAVVRSHAWIDARSLALHEAVAAKLEDNPALLDIASGNLTRWLASRRDAALIEWRDLLDTRPLPEILSLLRSPDGHAARLRQSSPFAGLLTMEERQTILDRYGSRRS